MKTKNTKHLIITTSLALILCLATLFGTTFAWFTTSVTTGTNTVRSADFSVTLEYSTDFSTWTALSDSSVLFNDVTLTPGQNTGVVYIRVTNGNTYGVDASVSIGTVTTTGAASTEMLLHKKAGVTATTTFAELDAGAALAATDIISNQRIAASASYIVAVAIELPTSAINPGVVDEFTITVGATQVAA